MMKTMARVVVGGLDVLGICVWMGTMVTLGMNAAASTWMRERYPPLLTTGVWWMDALFAALMAVVFYGGVVEVSRRAFLVR